MPRLRGAAAVPGRRGAARHETRSPVLADGFMRAVLLRLTEALTHGGETAAQGSEAVLCTKGGGQVGVLVRSIVRYCS